MRVLTMRLHTSAFMRIPCMADGAAGRPSCCAPQSTSSSSSRPRASILTGRCRTTSRGWRRLQPCRWHTGRWHSATRNARAVYGGLTPTQTVLRSAVGPQDHGIAVLRRASHRIAHCTCTQTPAPTWCDVLCHCKASLVGATPRRSTNVRSLGSKRDGHRHVDKFAAWHDPRYLRRLLRARDRMPNRAAATCQAVCCMPHVCAVNGGVARPISGDVFAVRCDAVNRSISSVAAACCVSRYSALLSNQSVADRYRTVRYRRSTRSTRTVANRSFLLNQRLMRLWSVQTPRS